MRENRTGNKKVRGRDTNKKDASRDRTPRIKVSRVRRELAGAERWAEYIH